MLEMDVRQTASGKPAVEDRHFRHLQASPLFRQLAWAVLAARFADFGQEGMEVSDASGNDQIKDATSLLPMGP